MRKVFIIILIIIGLGVSGLYFWYRSGGLEKSIIGSLDSSFSKRVTESNEPGIFNKLLGFDSPRNYLFLFLNNTELRPGGGFIGAYAVVEVDKGSPKILKVEGTEILDNLAPEDFTSEPPRPIKEYLKISRWEFRDSNWSPDFAGSSQKGLELYVKEKGVSAGKIDAVIGITPTLLEEILKITGPITVNGMEFSSENFVEKMEYEVEFGYADKGLEFGERKQALGDMTHALLGKIKLDIFFNWSKYYSLIQKMIKEKQVAVYSPYAEARAILEARGLAGEMKKTGGDYLLWADANMAALKTDRVISRELSYSFAPSADGNFLAGVKMVYHHNGKFDKFTTRYRTYARVFVPIGSKFVSVSGSMKTDRSGEPGTVDQGVENNRQWFGTFISIEPGKTGELSWVYSLSPAVAEEIKNNRYSLLVQKQIGTIDNKLFLNLNFGKGSAGGYATSTDLREDREFAVKTAN